LDAESAPSQAKVIWNEKDDVVHGTFKIPATEGEQYVLALEKDDNHPAYYIHSPISAPSQVNIFCEDSAPHAELVVSPKHEGAVEDVTPFEVAITWGDEVIWRDSLDGEVRIEGAPVNLPIAWMVRSSGTAPAYGELTIQDAAGPQRLSPSLLSGWGEGLHLILPDGTPAANVPVFLDGEAAGITDSRGTLTMRNAERPTHLSLDSAHLRFFGGMNATRTLDSMKDRDDLGRLLLVLLPRD
jgi:hypothetical protein